MNIPIPHTAQHFKSKSNYNGMGIYKQILNHQEYYIACQLGFDTIEQLNQNNLFLNQVLGSIAYHKQNKNNSFFHGKW